MGSPSVRCEPAVARTAIRMSRRGGALVAGGRQAGSAAGRALAAPAPAHQGGAVIVAIGLMSGITSTSSRESFAKARQAATSISLS